MLVLAGSAALLGGAALIGAARPVDVTIDRPEARNRDVVLCLDISGSMAAYDAELVRTFMTLVTQFEGERIGLVIFNSSAATVFPLTDDYDFIRDELDIALRALAGDPEVDYFFAGTFNGLGTSLIGDGLTSCVSSFDRIDTRRARSVIFATDNELAGRPIIELDEAIELAKLRSVRVYGLNPEESGHDEQAVEMRRWSSRRRGVLRHERPNGRRAHRPGGGGAGGDRHRCRSPTDPDGQPRGPDHPRGTRPGRRRRGQPEVGRVTVLPIAPVWLLAVLAVTALVAVWWHPSAAGVPGESRAGHWRLSAAVLLLGVAALRPGPGRRGGGHRREPQRLLRRRHDEQHHRRGLGKRGSAPGGSARRHRRPRPRALGGAVLHRDLRPGGRVRLRLTTDTTALDAAVSTLLPEASEHSLGSSVTEANER